MFDAFRIVFTQYFWTPIPFAVLIIVGVVEGVIAGRLLKMKTYNKRIALTVLLANIISYFIEYLISVLLNGGHIMLVWVPWVKIIGGHDLLDYVISFPFIFIITLIIETFIYGVLLNKYFSWKVIFRTTFMTNLVTFIILIIIFNCIVFNFIKGEEIGSFDGLLPEIIK